MDGFEIEIVVRSRKAGRPSGQCGHALVTNTLVIDATRRRELAERLRILAEEESARMNPAS